MTNRPTDEPTAPHATKTEAHDRATVDEQASGAFAAPDPVASDLAEPAIPAGPEPGHTHAPRRQAGPIKSGRLAGLSMSAAIWTMAWPVLCESLLNSLIGLVDTFLASKISQAATDAVGGAAYVLWFMGLLTMAIGVGATALVSRSMGAGRMAVARATLGQAMLLAILGGLGLAVLLALLAHPLASILSLRGEAYDDFVIYLRAYCLGVPFSTVLFAGTACARGAGDTLRPLITMVAVNIVNLALVWTLAHELHLGVLGIGLGTAGAHAVGAGLVLYFHARGASGVRLAARWMRPHRVTIYRLVRLGLPNFFETTGMWIVNFTVILMVGWMSLKASGDAVAAGAHPHDSAGLLGAHLWAIRIEAFSFLPGFAMGTAAGAIVGQYLGAGAPHLARRAALICAAMAGGMMGLAGLLLIVLGGPIMHALSEQPAHRELTPQLLVICGLAQLPFGLAIVWRSTLHGAGDVRAVMLLTWLSQAGLRLPLAYAFSGVDVPIPAAFGGGFIDNPFPFDGGLPGLWVALCTELTIRAFLYGGRFFHGGWMRARV